MPCSLRLRYSDIVNRIQLREKIMEYVKKLVLVVGDDIKVRNLIAEILELQKYTVVGCEDEDAFSLMETVTPDIIILESVNDIRGFSLSRRLRELSNVPQLIVVDGNSGDEGIRAIEAGCDDYISKPFSPRELTTRVRAAYARALIERPNYEICFDRPFPELYLNETRPLFEQSHYSGLSRSGMGNTAPPGYNVN
jgi:DNA-binding response OmpR family regulator